MPEKEPYEYVKEELTEPTPNMGLDYSSVYSHQEELARLSSMLENQLSNNPRVPLSELREQLSHESGIHNLSDEELAAFEMRLERYVEASESSATLIEEYKEKGPEWESALFADMFGELPKGEVTLRVQSHFLYWEIADAEDWRLVGKKAQEVAPVTFSPADESDPRPKGSAFVFPSPPLPGLKAMVGAKKLSSNLKHGVLEGMAGGLIDAHEGRHAVDFLLEPMGDESEVMGLFDTLSEQSSQEQVAEVVTQAMEAYVPIARRMAKSEIIAFFEPMELFVGNVRKLDPFGVVPVDRWIRQLPAKVFNHVQKNSHHSENIAFSRYDYMENVRQRIEPKLVVQTGKAWDGLLDEVLNPTAEAFREEVLEALVAVEELARHSKLDTHEFMWLLQNQPLEQWRTLVRAQGNDAWHDYELGIERRRQEWTASGRRKGVN